MVCPGTLTIGTVCRRLQGRMREPTSSTALQSVLILGSYATTTTHIAGSSPSLDIRSLLAQKRVYPTNVDSVIEDEVPASHP